MHRRTAAVLALGAALVAALGVGARYVGGSSGQAFVDGHHFGYIRALHGRTITFDPADFLEGDYATLIARADGVIGTRETVPNDYYAPNPSKATADLRVSGAVKVTHVQCPGRCRQGLAGDYAGLAQSFRVGGSYDLSKRYHGQKSQYWVTVEHGVVTRIDEQYVP